MHFFFVSLRVFVDFCENGWSGLGGYCYEYNEKNRNWVSANAACRSSGGFLVDIQSQEENEFVQKLITDGTRQTLIGYRDVIRENRFIWDRTGTPGNFTNWNKGEPNDSSGEDCTTIWHASTGVWNDVRCGIAYPSICKKGKPYEPNRKLWVET